MADYISWDGKTKTWNPETGRYYVLTDGKTTDTKTGAYFSERVFFSFYDTCRNNYPHTLDGVRAGFKDFMRQYPDHNWRNVNPRIVQAPCAWDAPTTHVFVESIF
jgi:hypothetical protein